MNYTQRGEVVIGQIVWCQLYYMGVLSFQILINLSIENCVALIRS